MNHLVIEPYARWRERPIPGTPLAPQHPIPMWGASVRPTLSPEWADRLWKLAQQPERPTLEYASKLRIRVDPGLPPNSIVPRFDPADAFDLAQAQAAYDRAWERALADELFGTYRNRPRPPGSLM